MASSFPFGTAVNGTEAQSTIARIGPDRRRCHRLLTLIPGWLARFGYLRPPGPLKFGPTAVS